MHTLIKTYLLGLMWVLQCFLGSLYRHYGTHSEVVFDLDLIELTSTKTSEINEDNSDFCGQ